MKTLAAVVVLLSAFALGQEAVNSGIIPPPVKNHHILLVSTSVPATGEPFWIAVAPDGQLAILPLSQLQARMGTGYRPFTFGELQDSVAALISQNAALEAEVKRLQISQTAQSAQPSQSTGASQSEAQRREQQRRQAILTLLMGQQQQRINVDLNLKDCTKLPALCVGH